MQGSQANTASSEPAPDAAPKPAAEFLLARAPAEDASAYSAAELALAGELAQRAILAHRKGESVVAIDADSGLIRQGRPITAITVVNDNMPFLFDSVLGEITESAGEPTLVTHPVLAVRHGKTGVAEFGADLGPSRNEPGIGRISVIHVHVAALTPEAAEGLRQRLLKLLAQVRAAVRDWKPMLARLDAAISQFRYAPVPLAAESVAEAVAVLEWLRDDNFTFLGMRELEYFGGETTGTLSRTDRPGLGILADPDVLVLRRDTAGAATTPEIRAFLHGPEPLIVTKANAKSVVHRRIYLDYIGVKTYDAQGALAGELRIVGLFTSTAYTRSVMKIPFLRSKAQEVINSSGFDPHDHSGKALINVLESYPRDELFQIDLPTLRAHAAAILALVERPRVRALVRVDQFDRFVSVIVFVPRDRYDSDVRVRIGEYLKTVFEGRVSAFYPAFPEGGLARVHFIIGRSGGKTATVDPGAIEAAIREIIRTWEDWLGDAVAETGAQPGLATIAARFPDSYRSAFSPAEALADAARIASIGPESPIAIDYYRHADQAPNQAALKIHHHGEPVPLSRRVPILENMGFRVISERTFAVAELDGERAFIHDMELENAFGAPIDLSDNGTIFEEVFLGVWRGEADNDAYNALAQTAALRAREIVVLRAYGRYLQQAGIPQSQDFIASVLNRYPVIARYLHAMFLARFDPAAGEDREAKQAALKASVKEALDAVPSLDDDTILRRYLNLIESSLRTNFFAAPSTEAECSLAIKLESGALDGLPEPRPWREIFVYGAEVEGVHLRFGPVARGGLRWSDRAQDYRTEVLGLVKAQQVKNAVIVPVGAKGGFYPKRPPLEGGRDAIFANGIRAYKNFISSLLSITDNLEGDKVVPPSGVVRHDDDDPYFVVAADKGTATFSDTANSISQDHGFWLDDAFASGGSAGYDHKKMGITARGAWEAVKRHFREMDRDIQTSPFTVVGVGDMSGDVFGNGMLLSPKTRLLAAFDHRDIFLDPDPDEAATLAERQRLFALPRSSWQDYDKSKLSPGGAIVSRSQKSIELSPEAAAAIGLERTAASPAEIMNAILKAPVDLLWFGGIGTYVKASNESQADAGDRANDTIRVDATELRAKVIGEGANLGVTQRARIEFGLLGGRCNSDAIDNSAGVNTSDVEVNIKIALADAMRKNALTRPDRDRFLAEMTDEVAALVLANNYGQTLAISLVERRGMVDLPHQARFIVSLEARKLLDRKVETLPSALALAERETRHQPLTRAEIGVLLAYGKIVLFSDLMATDLPDDPALERELLDYFPRHMRKRFGGEIRTHRLRREIVATGLANETINRGGPSFVVTLGDLTGATTAQIVAAFLLVRDGFDLDDRFTRIDALDGRVKGDSQLDLYQLVVGFLQRMTAWHLKNAGQAKPLTERVAALRQALAELQPVLPSLLPPRWLEQLSNRTAALRGADASDGRELPEPFALDLDTLAFVPDIALIAQGSGVALAEAAKAFFAVTETFRIDRVEEAARSIRPADAYEEMALSRAADTIDSARRGMAIAALQSRTGSLDPVAGWIEESGERVVRTRARLQALTEGDDITLSRLIVAAGLMSDLATG